MGIYLVLYASLYRGHGILRVAIEERGSAGPLQVEGDPSRTVKVYGGRVIFGPNNEVLDDRIFFIDAPDFPISELVGKRLVPAESPPP